MRSVCCVVLLVVAGWGGDGPATDAGASVDTGSSASVMITAAAGGTVAASDGIFRLVIPPGALAADTRVSVTVVPRGPRRQPTVSRSRACTSWRPRD